MMSELAIPPVHPWGSNLEPLGNLPTLSTPLEHCSHLLIKRMDIKHKLIYLINNKC